MVELVSDIFTVGTMPSVVLVIVVLSVVSVVLAIVILTISSAVGVVVVLTVVTVGVMVVLGMLFIDMTVKNKDSKLKLNNVE